MSNLNIAQMRLQNQRLAANPLATPEDVVGWFGAVQAQDYPGAKWALGLRTTGLTSADLDWLFAEGKILRTHVMRPTWHFVLPADLRWLQKLTGPRLNATNAYYCRKYELDDATLKRGQEIMTEALQGGKFLTRTELAESLAQHDIAASGLRLAYLIMQAEIDTVICSGPLRGKQFTYALLDERAPQAKTLEPDEALAELTRRYFTAHGPATLQDYGWWSGLAMGDVRAGLELVKSEFASEEVNGKTYWFPQTAAPTNLQTPTVHLLPNFDEHVVAYKDHTASFDSAVYKGLDPSNAALLANITVLDGLVIGGWRRTLEKTQVTITTDMIVSLNEAERAALKRAAEDYSRFMELPVRIDV